MNEMLHGIGSEKSVPVRVADALAAFLDGETLRPTDEELARREGWIWVRDPRQ